MNKTVYIVTNYAWTENTIKFNLDDNVIAICKGQARYHLGFANKKAAEEYIDKELSNFDEADVMTERNFKYVQDGNGFRAFELMEVEIN